MYLDERAPATPLREVVGSGKVSLDPDAGNALVKLLNAQIDQAEGWIERISRLGRPAALGTNAVATAMSRKFERYADGDENSLLTVITAYREVLRQTHGVVSGAMRNFHDSDDRARAAFARLHR